MKILIALAAGSLSVAPLYGAITAVTDPVGFTTLTASNKPTSAGQINFISLNLTRPVAFQGAVPANGATTDGNGRTVLTFPTTVGPFNVPSYVEIVTGANAGYVSDVYASTANTITVADDITALITPSGNGIKVRPHWTFSTAFGALAAANSSALLGGTSLAVADALTISDPTAPTSVRSYYFNTTAGTWKRVVNGIEANGDAGSDVIPLGSGLQLERRSTTPASIVVVGAVKLGPTGMWVNGSSVDTTTILSNPYPLAAKRLDQSGLFNGDTSKGVFGGSSTTADTVHILDPQTGIITDFFYDTSNGLYGNRWKSGFTDASLYTVPAGAAVSVTRKAGRGPFVWYAPQPTFNLDPSITPPLSLVSAVSRRVHQQGGLSGGTFTGDINLPLSGNIGTECRNLDSSNSYTIVLAFSNPITGGSATINGAPAPVSISGNELAISAIGAVNQQIMNISATSVTDSYGQSLASVGASMRILKGDLNSTSDVSTSDINVEKAQYQQPLTFSNFRADVNSTGTLTTSDINIVKLQYGLTAP